MHEFYEQIMEQAITAFMNLEHMEELSQEQEYQEKKNQEIEMLKQNINKKRQAKRRAELLYLEGEENIEFYTQYKKKYDAEINEMESALRALEITLQEIKRMSPENLKIQAQNFYESWIEATTDQERNAVFSNMIRKVWYDRDHTTGIVTLEIELL